jgi:hypothetical protein
MIAFGDTIQALRKQRTMEHPPPKQPNFAGGLLGLNRRFARRFNQSAKQIPREWILVGNALGMPLHAHDPGAAARPLYRFNYLIL